jgi:hypothetical protein
MSHGGKRKGAGRKPKADELQLIEKLSPLDDLAFESLQKGVAKGDFQFTKLFLEYRLGKPQDRMDITTNGDNINGIDLSSLPLEEVKQLERILSKAGA